jgi:hypothetical protein
MPHKKGTDRDQLLLLPPSLDDFLEEGNPVRVIETNLHTLKQLSPLNDCCLVTIKSLLK